MTVHTGNSGNDTFTISSPTELVAGDTYDGTAGVGVMQFLGNSSTIYNLAPISLIGIQTIDAGYSTVSVTPAQIASVPRLLGQFQVAGTSAVSLSGKTLGIDFGNFSISLDPAGGTLDVSGAIVSTGVAFNIFGGSNGSSNITGGARDDNIFVYGNGNTVHTGSGNDHIVDYVRTSGTLTGVFDGGSGNNTLVLDSSSRLTIDISQATLNNIQTLDSGYNSISLSAAQLGSVTTILGSFQVLGSGPVSLAGKSLGTNSGTLSITLNGAGGTLDASGATVLPGVAFNIFGGSNGGNTITGTPGNDYINSYGLGDTIHAGDGNDTVTIYANGPISTNFYDGGSGVNVLSFVNRSNQPIDLTRINYTNFQGLYTELAQEVDLTRAQLSSFSAVGGGTFRLLDGGSVTLSGNAQAIIGPYGGSATLQLAAAGNAINLQDYHGTITVNGGAGNDTIYGPNSGGAALYGGGGNNLIIAGVGPGVYENIDGGGGVTTLQLSGNLLSYDIQRQGISYYISSPSGANYSLTQVSLLAFADRTFDLRTTTIVSGGGKSVQIAAGQIYELLSTGTTPDTVQGSGGTVNLTNADATVTGDSNTIAILSDRTAVSVVGSLDSVVAKGTEDTVTIGGNGAAAAVADTVTLPHGGVVHVTDNSHVDVIGSGASVTAGTGATLGLTGSANTATVSGNGATVWIGGNGTNAPVSDAVTLQQGGMVHVAENSRVDVIGSGATVFVGSGDTLGLSGSAEVANVSGTGTTVWVGGNGTNAPVANAITLSQGGIVHVADGSHVDVIGSGASVFAGTADVLGLTGSANSARIIGPGTTVWVGGNGAFAPVANAVTFLQGGTAHVADASRVDVIGSGTSVFVGASDTLGLGGSGDNLTFGQTIGHTVVFGFNASDQLSLNKASFGVEPAGFDYWAHLLDTATVAGGDTTLTIDANDSIVLKGFTLTPESQGLFHFL